MTDVSDVASLLGNGETARSVGRIATFRPDSHRALVNRRAARDVFGNKEARMDVLESLVDDELRLELVLIEALHHEAERLAAPAVR
ncbi:hypothetical protein SAMN05421833_115116 [Microbispora rosea]|uniref:Uncharacterized protein n=1 Tax=Microbispora rosea TaxID=58117 RepID=A0A1N7DR93_9ACTN|nr:hypothetical protein SAMN05421833_115116 [Microbispora rosea]